jgi:DNA-binding Xre family transcriptional regulator
MYRLRVREVAEAQGLDQSKLARRTDLAFKTIQKLWHHPEQDVQLSTLARIARVLVVKVTDLIEDQERDTLPESERA